MIKDLKRDPNKTAIKPNKKDLKKRKEFIEKLYNDLILPNALYCSHSDYEVIHDCNSTEIKMTFQNPSSSIPALRKMIENREVEGVIDYGWPIFPRNKRRK